MRNSSASLDGRKVRLALAVVAHFEPEILAFDEVPAVGDAEFQRNGWRAWLTEGCNHCRGAGRTPCVLCA
jgi:ABC-type polysaccharide/polyol phosphate transport system ATPase subunit